MALEAWLLPLRSGAKSESIWQKALDRLDHDIKKDLDFKDSDKRTILMKVLRAAEQKKNLCLQERWKFKSANGDEVIIRDVIEKIINWLNTFKAIGDMAMQYDPGQASLPWAGLVVGDTQTFGAMIESLETVSRLITRYAMFEELYLQRASSVRAELLEALTVLYTEILTVLANANKYFRTSTLMRVVKSPTFSFSGSRLREIAAHEFRLSDLARLFDAEVMQGTDESIVAIRGLLESLERPIYRLANQSTMSLKSLESEKFLKLLQWLSPVPYSRHHEYYSEIRLKTTGEWLQNHPEYIGWNRSSSSSLLLVHGVRGSGKTILASATVDSVLKQNSEKTQHAQLAYFYCAKNGFEPERSDPDDILRSLVRQLTFSTETKKNVYEGLVIDYERREAEAKLDGFDVPRLRTAECIKMILDLTALNPLVLIIDAIDEVQASRRHELIDGLNDIIAKAANVVKVLLTTRNDSHIFALLPETQKISILKSDNAGDMEKFVRQSVAHVITTRRLLNGNVNKVMQEEIIQLLLKGAGEMFLWVILQIENLCHMKHEADVRESAHRLPTSTLQQLYSGAFETISEPNTSTSNVASQAFGWLICTQEALSPASLLTAISINNADRREKLVLPDLLNICSNFIILDSKLNIMRFAHTSILEFLESKSEFALARLHSMAAISCLTMCTIGVSAPVELGLRPTECFDHYALLYWAEHCRLARRTETDEELSQRLNEFVFDEDEVSLAFTAWMDQVHIFSKTLSKDHFLRKSMGAILTSVTTPLFVACTFGLLTILKRINGMKHIDWNLRNSHSQTGLYIASAFGHTDIVHFLVRNGADVHARGGKFITSLQAACFGGHKLVVEELLNARANPWAQGAFEDALQASLLGGQEDIALLLLDNDFNIRNQVSFGAAFQRATEAGFVKVVAKLNTKYSSSYKAPIMIHSKAIEAAIKKGQVGVLDRYLRHTGDWGPDLPIDGVSMAAFGGHDPMIELLLERGQEIEQSGCFGSPLRVASLMGHESTTRLLLERGANIDACNVLGSSLQAAAVKGHLAITRILLQQGANVNLQGGHYGTALQAACYHGHLEVVQALLNAGASIHMKGISRDAVHAAVDTGHDQIVNFFLSRGYKFSVSVRIFAKHSARFTGSNIRDIVRDSSPTRQSHRISIEGSQVQYRKSIEMQDIAHEQSFYNILCKKRDIEAENGRGTQRHQNTNTESSPLRSAAAENSVFAVNVCLENAENKDSFAGIGAQSDQPGGIERLISNKTQIHDTEQAIETAAFHGHLDVVEILLELDKSNRTPEIEISRAVLEGTTADGVTSNMRIPESYIKNIETILMAGCRGKKSTVVAWALDNLSRNNQLVQCSTSIIKVLHEAVRLDNYEIVNLLLRQNGIAFEANAIAEAFDSACQLGSKSVLLILVENDKDHKTLGLENYQKGLETAARKNHGNVLDFLLTSYLSIQDLRVSEELFLRACGNGFVDIVRSLHEAFELFRGQNVLNHGLNISCQNGHKDVVDLLLHIGADVMAQAEEVCDALLLEALTFRQPKRNALETALQGLHRFETPNMLKALFPNMLRQADLAAQEATTELIISKMASIGAMNSVLQLPLLKLVKSSTTKLMKKIVGKDSLINTSSSLSKDLLLAAAGRESGAGILFNVLLQAGAIIPDNSTEISRMLDVALAPLLPQHDRGFPILRTVQNVLNDGPGKVIQLILSRVHEIEADNPSFGQVLQMAAVIGDTEFTNLLLNHGVDANAIRFHYGTALQAASRHGKIKVVELLLDFGADVNAFGGAHSTALHAAVKSGEIAVVQRLLNAGASTRSVQEGEDARGTPLRIAVEENLSTIAKMLIQHGADPKSRLHSVAEQDWGRVPISLLHQAVKNKNDAILKSLLAAGADPNFCAGRPKNRWCILDTEATPLHMACDNSFALGVQILLDYEAEADVNIQQEFNISWLSSKIKRAEYRTRVAYVKRPLQVAAYRGSLVIVKLLIQAGAEVNYYDSTTGHTALSMASSQGHLEVVEELIEAGASIFGSIPMVNSLVAACGGRHHHIVQYLLEELSERDVDGCVYAEAMYAMNGSEYSYDDMTQFLHENGVPRPLKPCPEAIAAKLKISAVPHLSNGYLSNEEKGDDRRLRRQETYVC